MWIFVIVFLIIGILSIISPKASWYLSNWWKFDGDVEPSSVSLFLYRLSGIVLTIVGFVLMMKLL
ncbi:MAG: DUF6199 family natural product biosynthesis protein [Bacillota bacterium]